MTMRRLATRPVAVFGVIAALGVGAVLVMESGRFWDWPVPSAPVERVQTPAPFAALTVDGPLKVLVRAGEPELRFDGDEDLLRYVTVTTSDDELVILFAGKGTAERAVTATVRGRGISRLRLDGAVTLDVTGGLAPDLSLSASGAASVMIAGQCESLVLDLAQAARAELKDYDCKSVKAALDHAARAEVRARDRLDAHAGGVAELIYHGKPADLVTDAAAEGRIAPASP